MNKILKWFVGKRTYTALGVLLVKQVAEAAGVEVTTEAASTTIDVLLLLLAGIARAACKPAPGAPQPHEM